MFWGIFKDTEPFKSARGKHSVRRVKRPKPCGAPLLEREERDEEAHFESGSTSLIFFNFHPHKTLVKVKKSYALTRCAWSYLEKFEDE